MYHDDDCLISSVSQPKKVAKPTKKVATERNKDGYLKAHTLVHVTDIFGNDIARRVSLGTDWNTTLESARERINTAREKNPSIQIQAEFRINL